MKEETPALTQSPSPSPPSEPVPSAASRPRRSGVIAAFVLIAVGAAVGAWQVFELRGAVAGMREEVAQRLAAGDAALAEARGLARQQQESIAALQGKLGAIEAQVAATEGHAAALENLYQEFSRTRDDRVLAEAEQAVSIAAQQLQLAGNLEAALIALQGAEARLAAQDRGQFQGLRRALVRDIDRLKAAPQVDVGGIALRLEALLERADGLPLAFAGELAPNPAPAGSASTAAGESSPLGFIAGLGRDLWREIVSLVRIERLDQAEPVLLAPAQSTFLRENLKIRLLTARLALLARDGRTFAADLAQARTWVERYFDRRDKAVGETIAELAALQTLPVKVDQAAPTESLAALRILQARSVEPQAPAAASAPAAARTQPAASPATNPPAPAAAPGANPAGAGPR